MGAAVPYDEAKANGVTACHVSWHLWRVVDDVWRVCVCDGNSINYSCWRDICRKEGGTPFYLRGVCAVEFFSWDIFA